MNDDLFDKIKNIDVPPVPNLAKGTSIPLQTGKLDKEVKEAKEKEIRKENYKHNWRVAVFGAVFGAIFGFIASLIFWLIENHIFS